MSKLKQLEKYSLTDTDIKKVFKGKKINIIQYQNLPKYKHIDELFKHSDFKFCVLFFPENKQENKGHWTCIIKHKNGEYEYFDSYKDYPPDSELKWLSAKLKKELHFERPFLTDLFLRSGVDTIIYNQYPFQSQRNGINTCGDQVCSRLLHSNLSIDDYWKMIKKTGKNPDEFVTTLIYNIIGK